MDKEGIRQLKLIQINIWGGKLGYELINFLQSEKPDVVCMQEVHDLKGISGALFATLDEIKEAGNFEFSAMSAAYSFKYMRRSLEYGNALLSSLPIEKTKTVFTRGQYVEDYDVTINDYNIRNFQHVVLDNAGQKINVLNHHGHHIPDSKEGDGETLRQMKILAEYLDNLSGPTILAGDFNLKPQSASLELINSKLDNLSVKYGLQRTYNDFSNVHTVSDYIFVNDLVKVKNFSMSDKVVSDHKALILEFDI